MYGESAWERFLGCKMIAMMPNQGLDEALSSLHQTLRFYMTQPAEAPPVCTELAHGTVVGHSERAHLVIEE